MVHSRSLFLPGMARHSADFLTPAHVTTPRASPDQRTAPMGNAFLNFGDLLEDRPGQLRRCRSYSDYVPYDLLPVHEVAELPQTLPPLLPSSLDTDDNPSETHHPDLSGTAVTETDASNDGTLSRCSTVDCIHGAASAGAAPHGMSSESDCGLSDVSPVASQGLQEPAPPQSKTGSGIRSACTSELGQPSSLGADCLDRPREPNEDSSVQEEITTLMIRNLPERLAKQDLLQELDRSGFSGLYDYCYMPRSFESGESQGFAFVNCTSAAAADSLASSWNRTRRFGLNTATLSILPAAVQGLEKNMAKWEKPRGRRIRNTEYVPFVREAGDSGDSTGAAPKDATCLDSRAANPPQPERSLPQPARQRSGRVQKRAGRRQPLVTARSRPVGM